MAGTNFSNQLVLYSSGGYTRAIAGDTISEAAALSLGATLNVDGASTMGAITSDGALIIQDSSGNNVFEVDASNGNTDIGGTIGVGGNASLSGTLGVTGAATLSNSLDVAGSKFTVAASTGNTAISGSLAVTSHLEVGVGPKMSVNASSGNLATTGSGDFQSGLSSAGGDIVLDADASNSVILRAEVSSNDVDMLTVAASGITLGADLMLHGMTEHQILHAGSSGLVEGDNNFYFDGTDFKVGGTSSPKFSVAVSDGDVATSGDLSVAGHATISGNLTVSGTTTTVDTATLLIQDNLIISNSSPASAADGGFLTKLHPADWGADSGLTSFTVKSWDGSSKELTVEIIGTNFGDVSVDDWKDRVIYDDNYEYATITASSAGTDLGNDTYEFVIEVSGGFSAEFASSSSGYGSVGTTFTSSTAKIATSPKKYVGLIYDTSHSSNTQYDDKFVLGHWSADLDTASDAGDADGRMALGVGLLDVADMAAFGSSVSVTGDIYASASANVSQTLSARSISQNNSSGTLSVLGAASFGNTAEFEDAVSLKDTTLIVKDSSSNTMVSLSNAGTIFAEGAISASGINSDANVSLSSAADFGMADGSSNSVFTIDGATGNTAISGTLGVTGAATFSSTISAATGSSIGNLTLANGSITDSSGSISFDDEDLSTSGALASGNLSVTGTAAVSGNATVGGTLGVTDAVTLSSTLSAGASTLASATISGAASISGNASVGGTLGVTGVATFANTISAASGSSIGSLSLADGSITDSSGSISFGDENLSTTGTLASGDLTVSGSAALELPASGSLSITDESSISHNLFKVEQGGDVTIDDYASGNGVFWDSSNKQLIIKESTEEKFKFTGGSAFLQTGALAVYSDHANTGVSGDADGYVTHGVSRFTELSTAPAAVNGFGMLYVKDDGLSDAVSAELFFMDEEGNEVKITENGALSISGISFSLDDAYDDGRSITADSGTVMITRAASSASGPDYRDSALHLTTDGSTHELTNVEPMLQIDVGSGNYSAALNGIKVDLSSASVMASAQDSKGIELRGKSNTGSGKSAGLVVDSAWDLQAEFGDMLGGSEVRITAGSSDDSELSFYSSTAKAAFLRYDGSESEFLINSQNHELVIESGTADLYLETSGELSVVPSVGADDDGAGTTASWSDGDILCFGAHGGLQAADKSAADVGDKSCPIGVAMDASSLSDNSIATVHGSVVAVSTDLSTMDNGTALYLHSSGSVSDTPSSASGDEVWRVGFVFDKTSDKMIWMPQFIMSNP